MALFSLKAKGKTKPMDDIEEEDEVRAKKFLKTNSKAPAAKTPDPANKQTSVSNMNLANGKIHVEVLYRVFDQYRVRMGQSGYGSGDPFLMERRVATLRAELKQELTSMGFDEILDFSFIPMPPPNPCGVFQDKETGKLVKAGEKPVKAKPGKKKPAADEDDDED